MITSVSTSIDLRRSCLVVTDDDAADGTCEKSDGERAKAGASPSGFCVREEQAIEDEGGCRAVEKKSYHSIVGTYQAGQRNQLHGSVLRLGAGLNHPGEDVITALRQPSLKPEALI
jgi:hypothetical protein